MTTTSYGFTGSLNAATWAAGEAYTGPRVASTSDLVVTAVGGSRAVSVAAGEAFSSGVRVVNDSPVTVTLATPTNGQWYLIVLRRDWGTNTATYVALPGPTTSTTTPSTAPTSAPSGLQSTAGSQEDQPLAWAWVNFTSTTVTLFDVRLVLTDGLPHCQSSAALNLLRGQKNSQIAGCADGNLYIYQAGSWQMFGTLYSSVAATAAAQATANTAQSAAGTAQSAANAAQSAANAAQSTANTAKSEAEAIWNFTSAIFTAKSGWSLNRGGCHRNGRLVQVDFSVTRTGSAITVPTSSNLTNVPLATLPSGNTAAFTPSTQFAALAAGPGGPFQSGFIQLDTSTNLVTISLAAWGPGGSGQQIATGQEVTLSGVYLTSA